ncbi:MAG: 2-oxo acid dehydrogenase subunit E2 [Deltaproteobacteria bacterium]|nr:2-oxo acid dehydrogenase subunit E2 [Deltaproteobacteria bacterium]
MADFIMPSLGADMDRGTILRWYKQPGDRIERGEIVVLVDTDKAEIEVESFGAGWLDAVLVNEGETVPVGTAIARIRTGAGEPERPTAPAARPAATVPTPAPVPPTPPRVAPPAGSRVHASPLARRIAADLGVDLARVTGSGPEGAITREDVERAAARPAPAPEARPAGARGDKHATMRSAIAAAMERANREIPHYYLATRVDLSRALAWLAEQNASRPLAERVLPVALFLAAVGRAAVEVPELNGFWRDGGFVPGEGVNVGVIISLRQGGILAPALRDVPGTSVTDLFAAFRELVARARAGKLRSSDVAGGTITVTSLGDQGVETVYGVILPPQVALVGFGKISDQPFAEHGLLGVKPVVEITLAADHRASDGHRGGRFLAAIARLLQEPESL